MRSGSMVAIAVAVAACHHHPSPVGPVRFTNAPPVWRVDDRHDVPRPPRELPFRSSFYHFDAFYIRTIRGLDLTRHRRALGVNSLDEVPDSTWFVNRIGVRDFSPAEIEAGPGNGDSPEGHFPWTIEGARRGINQVSYIVRDCRGRKFVLKFDRNHIPEVESGADAVVSRLLWASGWNVPSDHAVYFRRGDIVVSPKAKLVDRFGEEYKFGGAFLDEELQGVAIEPDGRIRGLASMYIPGKPLGGAPRLGVREDDPNDRIPHQLRRDLRGFAPLSAWLAVADLKQENTLDAWQADPVDPRVRYVVHYLIDFGKSLGAMAASDQRWYPDYQYNVDPREWSLSVVTLGIHRQPWEGRPQPRLRGIGLYSANHYDPGAYKPNTMGYLAVVWADRFDQFWGAKILIRFTRPQLAAAVAAARFTNPQSAAYLLDTLQQRQRITARHWFRKVNPVDELTIEGSRLCFVDLAMRHRLEWTATRFTATAYDRSGRALPFRATIDPDPSGHACVEVPLAADAGRYTIIDLESSRGMPGTLVHLAVDAGGHPRVIGLHRK